MSRHHGGEWLNPLVRQAIYIRDDYRCGYCGATVDPSVPLSTSVDHVVPLDAGGTDEPGNLITACMPCNRAKWDKLLAEFCALRGIDADALLERLRASTPLTMAPLLLRARCARMARQDEVRAAELRDPAATLARRIAAMQARGVKARARREGRWG